MSARLWTALDGPVEGPHILLAPLEALLPAQHNNRSPKVTLNSSPNFTIGIALASKTGDTIDYSGLLKDRVRDIILLPQPISFIMAKLESAWNLIRASEVQEVEALLSNLRLTRTEQALFNSLLLAGAMGCTRDQLVDAVWGKSTIYGKTLDTHIFNLRRKIESLQIYVQYDRTVQLWVMTSKHPRIRTL